MFSRTRNWVLAHRYIAASGAVIFVLGTWWSVRALISAPAGTKYVLGTVEKGTIVASVSASGQVSASNQVDITSKVAGDVTSVPVKAGQHVAAGALIAQVDPGDAAFELESQQLSYEDLTTVDQSELRDAQDAADTAATNLDDAYLTARTTLASTATGMADTISGLDDLLDGYLDITNDFELSRTARSYVERAEAARNTANTLLESFSKTYFAITDKTDNATVERTLADASSAASMVAEAAKSAKDAVIYLRDHTDDDGTEADDAYTTVNGLVTSANSAVSSAQSAKNSLVDKQRAQKNTAEDLQTLKDGPDTLDLRSAQLALRQKQQTLADYSIRAPFAGVLASLDVTRGDTISSNKAIATLITPQKVAELSLNEVDAAKIQVGDKATLTFDAIENLTLTGKVAEIDSIGTVTQGVVSYTVKIGFDSQDERVKPGMTVNAAIITDTKQDVLVVPSSAVKTQNGVSMVQLFNPALGATGGTQGVESSTPPQQAEVETGISDDTSIEIVSGLEEGEQIVTRTISGTPSATATTNRNAGFGGGALGGGGRGAFIAR